MTEKIYLRFKELKQHFNITSDEILYHIENSDLKLSFPIQASRVLVGRLQYAKFVAFGIGTYEGTVTVSRAASLKLFTDGKAKCGEVFIRQNSFSSYSDESPFSADLPNSGIASWEPKRLNEIGEGALFAKLNPHEGPSGAAAFQELTDMLKRFSDGSTQNKMPAYDPNKAREKAIYFDDFKFTLEQSCLLTSDLVRIGLIGLDSASKLHSTRLQPNSQTEPNKPNRPENEKLNLYYRRGAKAKRIVFNLIEYAPEATNTELWSMLKKALGDDELLDRIDPEREVLDVTIDKILWNVPEHTPERQKQITRGRFNNIVTELKKLS